MEQLLNAHTPEFIILIGAICLLFSWHDYRQDRVSTAGLLDWVGWWTIDRDEAPAIFLAFTIGQFALSITCMLTGFYLYWHH